MRGRGAPDHRALLEFAKKGAKTIVKAPLSSLIGTESLSKRRNIMLAPKSWFSLPVTRVTIIVLCAVVYLSPLQPCPVYHTFPTLDTNIAIIC